MYRDFKRAEREKLYQNLVHPPCLPFKVAEVGVTGNTLSQEREKTQSERGTRTGAASILTLRSPRT